MKPEPPKGVTTEERPDHAPSCTPRPTPVPYTPSPDIVQLTPAIANSLIGMAPLEHTKRISESNKSKLPAKPHSAGYTKLDPPWHSVRPAIKSSGDNVQATPGEFGPSVALDSVHVHRSFVNSPTSRENSQMSGSGWGFAPPGLGTPGYEGQADSGGNTGSTSADSSQAGQAAPRPQTAVARELAQSAAVPRPATQEGIDRKNFSALSAGSNQQRKKMRRSFVSDSPQLVKQPSAPISPSLASPGISVSPNGPQLSRFRSLEGKALPLEEQKKMQEDAAASAVRLAAEIKAKLADGFYSRPGSRQSSQGSKSKASSAVTSGANSRAGTRPASAASSIESSAQHAIRPGSAPCAEV